MTKIELVKNAVSTVVGFGAATVVRSIISNNVQPDDIPNKVTVASASVVFGLMAADLTKRYTDAKIDEIVQIVNDARQR